MCVELFIKLEDGATCPTKGSAQAAGFDLYAYLPIEREILVNHRKVTNVPVGFSMEMPFGWEAQIRPRSGLALKHGITVVNSPGTIDSDYRGQVGILLNCLTNSSHIIKHGDRIAQMVIKPVHDVELNIVTDLSKTDRGTSGFGSTGTTGP
tara:strand:+ start:4345 stop:4797 length:453 start_codon:yes stop_codon:yes gene_type:complete